jgi:hypothetical protein
MLKHRPAVSTKGNWKFYVEHLDIGDRLIVPRGTMHLFAALR